MLAFTRCIEGSADFSFVFSCLPFPLHGKATISSGRLAIPSGKVKQQEAMLGAESSPQQSEVKSQHPKKIQVRNVPMLNSVQRTLDKLTIHFQTQSNGGGEVLEVEYPTCVKDCAFITFVTEKDANNVLKHEQILKLDKKEYMLEVCKAGEGESTIDDVQVIEFVNAELDTSNFTTEMAHQLIQKYNFEILSYQGSVVEIKGSFSSLKKLRSKLMDLILHQSLHAIDQQPEA